MKHTKQLIVITILVVLSAVGIAGFSPATAAAGEPVCGGGWCVTYEGADGDCHEYSAQYIGNNSIHWYSRTICGSGHSQTDTGWEHQGGGWMPSPSADH